MAATNQDNAKKGTFVNKKDKPDSRRGSNTSFPDSRRGSGTSFVSTNSDDFDNILGYPHDCANHDPIPPTEDDGFCALYPFSYRGHQLLGRSRTIRHMNRTQEQRQLEYSFLRNYFEFDDIQKLSDYRLHTLLWGWIEHLDYYCFGRTLTTNEEPIFDLTVREAAPFHARFRVGITNPYFRDFPDALKCFTTIYRSADGVRRTKLQLLETIVHELTHVYLETFYDRCPVENNDPVYLKGPDHDGHGELFYLVLEETFATVRGWHVDLASLGVNHRAPLPPPSLIEQARDMYLELLGTNSRLQHQWIDDGTWIEVHELMRWPATVGLQAKYDYQYENLVHDRKTDLMTIITTDVLWIVVSIAIVGLVMVLATLLTLYLLVLGNYTALSSLISYLAKLDKSTFWNIEWLFANNLAVTALIRGIPSST